MAVTVQWLDPDPKLLVSPDVNDCGEAVGHKLIGKPEGHVQGAIVWIPAGEKPTQDEKFASEEKAQQLFLDRCSFRKNAGFLETTERLAIENLGMPTTIFVEKLQQGEYEEVESFSLPVPGSTRELILSQGVYRIVAKGRGESYWVVDNASIASVTDENGEVFFHDVIGNEIKVVHGPTGIQKTAKVKGKKSTVSLKD